MDKDSIVQAIIKQGVLPLYYHASADVSIAVAEALYRGGVRVIEYTNRGENAQLNFGRLKSARDESMPGLLIGVGTIKTKQAAEDFLNLEADFLVSPGIITGVGMVCSAANKLWIPGCMTVTEIIQAEEAGAKLVKIFPGNILGPEYVIAIRELFPELLFMPTGGVDTTVDNLQAWFHAGVSAVGMGSKLISKPMLEAENYAGIEEDTTSVLRLIESIRR